MVVSYEHNFLFIHNQKTAGSSIRSILQPYSHYSTSNARRKRLKNVKLFLPMTFFPHYKLSTYTIHMSALRVRWRMPKDIWQRLFKFAFVRNPWAREVSYYNYYLQREHNKLHETVRQLGSFKAFLAWRANDPKRLQSTLLCDNDEQILVDFVGRFEKLSDDFAYICQKIGIPLQLSHTNKSHHADYRSYYDTECVDIVASAFEPDIRIFNYQFE